MEEAAPSDAPRPPFPRPPPSDDNASSSFPTATTTATDTATATTTATDTATATATDTATATATAHRPRLTYIIQVPKDQIYRIPPQENGHLIEQYHARHASRRHRHSPPLLPLLRLICILFTTALLLVLSAALLFIVFVRPIAPVFHINHIVTDPSKARWDIFMEATNPSFRMGYAIEESGRRGAEVSYKGRILAGGEFPQLRLEAKGMRRFRLLLHGAAKKAAPTREEELRLVVAATARAEISGLRLWGMKMKVGCEVWVKSLGKETKVVAQECKVSIGVWGGG